MASNRLPDAHNQLMALATSAINGASALGAEIPLLINTTALIKADRTACLDAQVAFQKNRSAQPAIFDTLKKARIEAQDFCIKARNWLKNFLGEQRSDRWLDAGWSGRSLAIPEGDAALDWLMESLENYLREHPEHECAQLKVTSERAGELQVAFSDAITALNMHKGGVGKARGVRNQAVETLRARLRGLRGELQQRLGAADPRWRRFGFNIPAQTTTPDVPQIVTVNENTPGEPRVKCAPSAHAAHYRFFTQRPGVDAEPVFAGRSKTPSFQFIGLEPGQEYQVFVTAANRGSESRRSEPFLMVMKTAQEASAPQA